MKTVLDQWLERVKRNAEPFISAEEQGQILRCIDDLDDACTPRPPQPEWFGTGPGQWDSWTILGLGQPGKWRPIQRSKHWQYYVELMLVTGGCLVVPVRRPPDPPAMDVGWGVIDGSK